LKLTIKRCREVPHVKKCHRPRPPPRRAVVTPLVIDQLWSLLTDDQRQRTLLILSGIVLRQLDAPRDDLEVRDEDS
jgi:hypothetical protein